jgi:hypothetical protein
MRQGEAAAMDTARNYRTRHDALPQLPAQPCLLCGRRPHWRVVYTPRDQAKYGAPAGKVRAVVYSICRKCRKKPGHLREVERRIAGEFGVSP